LAIGNGPLVVPNSWGSFRKVKQVPCGGNRSERSEPLKGKKIAGRESPEEDFDEGIDGGKLMVPSAASSKANYMESEKRGGEITIDS